eukprot:7574396-Ditylum_brightwellii.AAC.1
MLNIGSCGFGARNAILTTKPQPFEFCVPVKRLLILIATQQKARRDYEAKPTATVYRCVGSTCKLPTTGLF